MTGTFSRLQVRGITGIEFSKLRTRSAAMFMTRRMLSSCPGSSFAAKYARGTYLLHFPGPGAGAVRGRDRA